MHLSLVCQIRNSGKDERNLAEILAERRLVQPAIKRKYLNIKD
jgi:hypothetical protein